MDRLFIETEMFRKTIDGVEDPLAGDVVTGTGELERFELQRQGKKARVEVIVFCI